MSKYFIGCDNGVSGSLGVVNDCGEPPVYVQQFTKTEQSYTKKKQNITRIDYPKLYEFLKSYKDKGDVFIACERPCINSARFKTTVSAARSLEATLIAIEQLEIPYQIIDSKSWQKELLPTGCKGKELKTASSDIANRLFPMFKDVIKKQGDGDGILIAEYIKRKGY